MAISIGIRDALGPAGKLVATWLEQEGTAGGEARSTRDTGATPPVTKSSISPRARAFFQGLPIKES